MSAAAEDQGAKIPPRAVAAVVVGNWLEFYDFIVFTFFAVMISKAFFPGEAMMVGLTDAEKEFYGLLATLATFGAGFVTRPLGAFIIGAYGDRAGRKAAMTLTILLMALGTGIVALTPTYAQIGIWAPIILVIGRLIQGFSCGGEVGAATSYLLESAPSNRRASVTAWQGTSQQFAGVAGAGLGLILAATLSEEALYDWGWRIPFLIGLAIGPVGLYIRGFLPDTIEHHEKHDSGVAVIRTLFANHSGAIFLGVLCIIGPTISTYVSGYMTTYAIRTLGHPADISMLATMVGYIAGIAGVPIGAWLADRIGYRTSVFLPRIAFLAVVLQAYVAMTAQGSTVETLLLVNIGLNFLLALSYGGLYVLLTEAFPKAVRSAGLSITYAIAVTIFGGSTQLVVAYLIEVLKDPLVPAWYQIGANIISLLGIFLIGMRARTTAATQAA
jgi:MFS family permease